LIYREPPGDKIKINEVMVGVVRNTSLASNDELLINFLSDDQKTELYKVKNTHDIKDFVKKMSSLRNS